MKKYLTPFLLVLSLAFSSARAQEVCMSDTPAIQRIQASLEPLAVHQGLRCAGIHKALKFHLNEGRYVLIVASDEIDTVKTAAERAP